MENNVNFLCLKCSNLNPENSMFCNKCGNKLIVEKKVCNKCLTENPENSNFCNKCGNYLTMVEGNVNVKNMPEDFILCNRYVPHQGLNYSEIKTELRIKHPIIPDKICEYKLMQKIEEFISLNKRTIEMRKDTPERVQLLDSKKYKFFFTAEMIKFLEGSFTSDGVNANYSPNALFGRRLKQLSIEKSKIMPFIQEYYHIDNKDEQSFPIFDDHGHPTLSALWIIKYDNIEKALAEIKNRLNNYYKFYLCDCTK